MKLHSFHLVPRSFNLVPRSLTSFLVPLTSSLVPFAFYFSHFYALSAQLDAFLETK